MRVKQKNNMEVLRMNATNKNVEKQNNTNKQNIKNDIENEFNEFIKTTNTNEIDAKILNILQNERKFAIERKTIMNNVFNENEKTTISYRTRNSRVYYALLRMLNNKQIVLLRTSTNRTYVCLRDKFDKLNEKQLKQLKQKYKIVM